MSRAPKTPEAIRRGVRTMAILTAVLGPVLVGSSLFPLALKPLLPLLRTNAHHNAPMLASIARLELLLVVSEYSALVMVPLGVFFLVAGVRARTGVGPGVAVLRAAAWAAVVGMLAGGGIWFWLGTRQDGGLLLASVGAFGHVLQGYLVYRAARYLARAEVVAATASAGGPEVTAAP
jgi:hypothetical protein